MKSKTTRRKGLFQKIQIEVMEKTFVYEQINNCLDNEGKDMDT
jgi:hypothetical protein